MIIECITSVMVDFSVNLIGSQGEIFLSTFYSVSNGFQLKLKNLLIQGQFITDPTSGCLNTAPSLGQTEKEKHDLDWGGSISISEAIFTSIFLLQPNDRLSFQPCNVKGTTNFCLSIFSFNVYFMYRKVVTATGLPGDSYLDTLKNG